MWITRTPARLLAATVALAATTLGIYLLGTPFYRGLSVAIAAVTVMLTVGIVAARTRGLQRWVYRSLFAGFFILAGVDIAWTVAVAIRGRNDAPQTLVNAGLIAGYLFLLGAAVLAIGPLIRQDSGGMLDAITLGFGAAVGLWLLVIHPATHEADMTASTRVFILAAVMTLGAAIGVIVGVWSTGAVDASARPSLAYFAVALVLAVVGNVITTVFREPDGTAVWWTGILWPVSYAAAWAAAAHPAGHAAFTMHEPRPSRLTQLRIIMLAVALASGPIINLALLALGQRVDWTTMAVAQVAMIGLVIVRVGQIASAHRDSEAKLQALADGDPLTGLANRRAVGAHLESLAARVTAHEAPGLVLCFMDLDGFKEVNDTHGHAVGDELLDAVAGRLAASVRFGGDDIVGRLGGDEFVVIFEGDPARIADRAQARVEQVFAEPFQLSVGPVLVGTSIGMSTVSPGEAATVDDLLTHADHAMYTHKRSRERLGGDSLS